MKPTKRNHWFLGTLLMITFLMTAAFPALAGTKGVLDPINGTSVTGWAWNTDTPDSPLEVTIKVTNQATGVTVLEQTATAATHREDLLKKGNGTGNYGFAAALALDTLEDGTYLVEAYAGGQKLTNQRFYGVGTAALNSQPLGVFKTTGYCPCLHCSEGWGRNTSTGAMAVSNHTIAVDPRVIPYGSKVMINGVIYTAEDKGGGVKGNHIDIFFNTHAETLAHGTTYYEAFLVQ